MVEAGRERNSFPRRDSEDKAQQKQVRITILGTNGLRLFARARVFDSQNTPWPGVYVSHDGSDNWQLFSTDLIVGTTVAEHEDWFLA